MGRWWGWDPRDRCLVFGCLVAGCREGKCRRGGALALTFAFPYPGGVVGEYVHGGVALGCCCWRRQCLLIVQKWEQGDRPTSGTLLRAVWAPPFRIRTLRLSTSLRSIVQKLLS